MEIVIGSGESRVSPCVLNCVVEDSSVVVGVGSCLGRQGRDNLFLNGEGIRLEQLDLME